MNLLSRLFGKRNGERISSTQRYEASATKPLIFRTEHGGSVPCGYVITPELIEAQTKPLKFMNQMIHKGLIDEFSDPDILNNMVDAYYQKAFNAVEEAGIARDEVAKNIIMLAKEELYIEQSQIDKLENARKEILEVEESIETDEK